MEVESKIALQHGAARPTAIDLTVAPEGKLNPNLGERCGRTDPQSHGQVPVREVVLSPVPVAETVANRKLILKGR